MFPPVFQTLKASVALRNFVGNPEPIRIYRMGEAPQGTTRPYVTWLLVSGTPENTLSETPATDRGTVQIDCWHPQDTAIVDMATAARDACEGLAVMTQWFAASRDEETRMFRISLTFDWFVDR